MKAYTDVDLRALTVSFKRRVSDGEPLEGLLPEAFAAVREAAARAIGERPFDVQVMGAAVLHLGMVAEMRAGEGKTLTAVMPAYLNALSGKSVHVITANRYLAQRDARWMAPVYRVLGMTTGLILPAGEQDAASRRAAYRADVTYGSWEQFSIDYLKDNCAWRPDECVQRGQDIGIVDDADILMIDQARRVVAYSSKAKLDDPWPAKLAKFVSRLVRASDGAGAYAIDERAETVSLFESGAKKVEDWLGIENLYATANVSLLSDLTNALAAKELYHRDRDYLVTEGRLVFIDKLSGRPDPGKEFVSGLRQAVEAKEGLHVSRETMSLAEIQAHDYLRLYLHLTAMASIASDESDAYRGAYGLEVVTIPANRPMVRVDHRDVAYSNTGLKLSAIADEVTARHTTGQPVLVGTTSVAQCAAVSALLSERGIAHEVLNAWDYQREAQVLAEAGRPGAVTVVTPVAGCGIGIRLGGADGTARDRAVALGGLCVLGAERRWPRRADLQLRDWAGRQGDPGESKFILSYDDDLFTGVLGPKSANRLSRLFEDGANDSKIMSRAIASSQMEFQARTTASLLEALDYDAVLAEQQRVIYADRRAVLLRADLRERVRGIIASAVRRHVMAAQNPADTRLWQALRALYPISVTPDALAADRGCGPEDLPGEFVIERLIADAYATYDRREAELGAHIMREVEARVILSATDRQWREHLQRMHAAFYPGIRLRSLRSRTPLADYRREAAGMFTALRQAIQDQSVSYLFNSKVEIRDNSQPDDC
jgi:preprotein translocase subunit SecA